LRTADTGSALSTPRRLLEPPPEAGVTGKRRSRFRRDRRPGGGGRRPRVSMGPSWLGVRRENPVRAAGARVRRRPVE
jgi:hypothetical protein